MDREGIRNMLEKMLPEAGPPTENGDRTVWISDVIDVFYKVANTSPDDEKEFVEGGRYLCTSIKTSSHSFSNGMIEVKCLKVTEKAYCLEMDGKTIWVQKSWHKTVLERLG